MIADIWGFGSVGAMATTYALEPRGGPWSLGFAIASLSAAGYAATIGAWPFALVETIWAGIAVHRWLIRRNSRNEGALR